jgi:hypothetical protein
MEDSNLIACLYPAEGEGYAKDAICMRENVARYIPPLRVSKPKRRSRESTVPEDDEKNGPDFQPGLQLTFNLGPKAGQGFVIGRDSTRCDIVLLNLPSISGLYCVLTFDIQRRLILVTRSLNGIIVTYDEQGGEKRRTIVTKDDQGREKHHHFTWILSDEDISGVRKIVIDIQNIKFRIIVSKHETYLDTYNDNVDRFLREVNANDELPLGALGI